MEAWLSELEMTWNEDEILSHNVHQQEQQYHQQTEDGMDELSEELAAVLGDDFSFTNFNAESAISSILNCTTLKPTNISSNEPILSDQQLRAPTDNIAPIDGDDDHDYSPNSIEPIMTNDQQAPTVNKKRGKRGSSVSSDENAAKTIGKRKRRDPEQVHGHIMAERKRRELLAQRFIALSAMIPGLKKIDKTTILEEAIKHLGEIQKKVKVLEEAASKKKEGSITAVKKMRLVMDEDDDTLIKSNGNGSICSSGGSDDGDHQTDELPDVEVMVKRKTLLLRICCVRRKGILFKIYQELENRDMTILTSNVVTFESSTLYITIVAKMDVSEGYDKQLQNLVRTLHSILRVPDVSVDSASRRQNIYVSV